MLERRLGDAAPGWLLPTARHFFDAAMKHGWDEKHGGLVYGFAPGGDVCDPRRLVTARAPS